MFVRFSLKAFYILLIAFILSFIYGGAMFVLFEGKFSLEVEEWLLPASWGFGFGILIAITEKWWRFSDPNATAVVWGISTRFFGYLITLVAAYSLGSFIFQNGFTEEAQSVSIFTGTASIIMISIYMLKKILHSRSAHEQSAKGSPQ